MDDKELAEKLDSILKRLETLETPPAEEPKEDVIDPKEEKIKTVLKTLLKGSFTDEKLDAMTLDELLLGASLKEDFIADVGILPPTGGQSKEDNALDGVPEHLLAHYSPESGKTGLIQ